MALVVGAGMWACHGDVVNPRTPTAVEWVNVATTRLVASPGDILPDPFVLSVKDADGSPIRGARVAFHVAGMDAQVFPLTAITDAGGHVSARWRISTRASDVQSLTAVVATSGGSLSTTAFAIARPDRAIRLEADDTLAVRLGEVRPSGIRAVDQYGNVFAPDNISMTIADTAIARARGDSLEGRKRGYTRAGIAAAGAKDSAVVVVQQVAAKIVPALDTVRLTALGDTSHVDLAILDDRALEIRDTSVIVDAVANTVSARLLTDARVEVVSRTTGTGAITVRLGTVTATVHAVVDQVPTRVVLDHDSLSSDALRDRLPIRAKAFDRLNNPIPDGTVDWRSSDSSVATVSAGGLATTIGDGRALVTATTSSGVADTVPVRVHQRATTIAFPVVDLHVESFGDVQLPEPLRNDRNGYPVARRAALAVGDTLVLRVDSLGGATAIANGTTRVIATLDDVADTLPVIVAQRAARIGFTVDSVTFVALDTQQRIATVAYDAHGNAIAHASIATTIDDTAIARLAGAGTIQSVGNGTTVARFSVDTVRAVLPIQVEQHAVRIDVQAAQRIMLVTATGGALAIHCTAYDATDHPLTSPPSARAVNGHAHEGDCNSLTALSSGRDTLILSATGLTARYPIAIAIRPTAEEPLGRPVLLDSIPAGTGPWAPSARMNTSGEVELYTTGYGVADHRGDLHRYVSTDGITFRYDGVALRRDSSECDLRGSAIESVAIVPRSDGAGWRMFFSAGSFPCYGWQVFSAVSTDERTWAIEPGIRLGNGGTVPPNAPVAPPWPTGEGMDVDRLANGEWRMIVSAYERRVPAEDAWQITEWRSADQINWQYVGVVLSTRDVPREARASVYAPTIREFAPGLWRMIFTGDNRRDGDGRSRLWSAVSTDRSNWVFEGEVLGGVGSDILYSSLANERVYFLRKDGAGPYYLGQTRILMP